MFKFCCSSHQADDIGFAIGHLQTARTGQTRGRFGHSPVAFDPTIALRTIQGEVNRVLLEGKQRPVIIVDEAQHLRNDVLEDLRLLTNYEMDSESRLCLLFVGLTELRRRLQMSLHESLDQRIVMRYNSPGLSRKGLPKYLSHRLSVAGCELPLFEPASIEAIYQATQSLPRKVNRLVHYALTAAAIAEGKSVTEEHVQAAMSETGS